VKKSGSKILGIAAAIAVVIYWGNTIFGGKYSSGGKMPILSCKVGSERTVYNLKDYPIVNNKNREQLNAKGRPYLNLENKNEYRITRMSTLEFDGFLQLSIIIIDRDTGRLEWIAGDKVRKKGDPNSIRKLGNMRTVATGICDKVKNKNL
jgi:hypothetical protein